MPIFLGPVPTIMGQPYFNGTAPTASSLFHWTGTGTPIQSAATTTAQAYYPLSNHTAAGLGGVWVSTNPCYYVETPVDHQQYMGLAQQRVVAYRERTAEEQARQQALAQEQARRHQEHMRQHEQATIRSRELLLEHLTPAQRKTFLEKRWFIVTGGKTKTRYRIRTDGYAGNIDVMNNHNTIVHRLCAHCQDLPLHDHHLAQKISLEWDEEYFLKIANKQAA